MNVRMYKKLYKELREREHIGRLPETIFVEVRDYISAYAEKNHRVNTDGRLRNGKQAFTRWLERYHKERVRKPSEEMLSNMQLLGILFLYVWHVEAREDIEDDFLVEETIKTFNRNREYRRTFELPQPQKRRGRPPIQSAPVRRSSTKKTGAKTNGEPAGSGWKAASQNAAKKSTESPQDALKKRGRPKGGRNK